MYCLAILDIKTTLAKHHIVVSWDGAQSKKSSGGRGINRLCLSTKSIYSLSGKGVGGDAKQDTVHLKGDRTMEYLMGRKLHCHAIT